LSCTEVILHTVGYESELFNSGEQFMIVSWWTKYVF